MNDKDKGHQLVDENANSDRLNLQKGDNPTDIVADNEVLSSCKNPCSKKCKCSHHSNDIKDPKH